MPEFWLVQPLGCVLPLLCLHPRVPSWEQLQDGVLFGAGQVLVPQFLAQPGEGGTGKCRGILPSTNRLFYICLCKLTQYYVSLFQFEVLRLGRNQKVVKMRYFSFQANTYIEKCDLP